MQNDVIQTAWAPLLYTLHISGKIQHGGTLASAVLKIGSAS